MRSSDIAIKIIQDYLTIYLGTVSKWHGYSFKQESYSRWAAEELMASLKKETTPPLILIEEFRDKMDKYSCLNPSTSFIFSVAKDTAECIIDLLLS